MLTSNNAPETLDQDGSPPSSRMQSAAQVAARVQIMLRSDRMGRAQRRALVKGLVDGNPPYAPSDLRSAGRASQCNVNWRIAEKYLNQARSAFYDIFTETPTYATVELDSGTAEEREIISGVATEEYDWLLRQDEKWDATVQISQYEMVLYGVGPLIFIDDTDWRNERVLCRDLLLPEMAESDPTKWEEAAIIKDYYPYELYAVIRNEKQAEKLGWEPETVKQVIIRAHPRSQAGGMYRSWEWHQQQLKNNAYQYSAESNIIRCAHYLYREFPEDGASLGEITHTIVVNPEDSEARGLFLFRKDRRFQDWSDVIHPMYYDNDGGGYHHSVTGLGIKMYSAMAFQNKLICNLADKAFAPKVIFKPSSAQANEQWNMVTWSDYGRIPPGFDMLQVPVGSWMQDGLAWNRELTSMVSSNLAQYQSNITKESGNPITATEMQFRANMQAALGKTQLNHYYAQFDKLMDKKFQRAVRCPKGMPGGDKAEEFRQRCRARGVTVDMLKKCCAKITRVVGQGSAYMRQSSLQTLMGLAPMLNEKGRNNLLSDFIASHTGQSMVERYNPSIEQGQNPADQQVIANLQIAAAHTGVPPVIAPNQDSATFATSFTMAAGQAVQSVPQGGDPHAVVGFVQTIAPGAQQHIQRLAMDPSRRGMVQSLTEQWGQINQQIGQLERQLQQQMQQAQEQQQQMAQAQAAMTGTDPDLMLKQAELNAKLGMAQQKTDAMIAMKVQKHNQGMVLDDARTAADLQRTGMTHRQQMEHQSQKLAATKE